MFISVRVQDQLSAYTVFETLNARGLELTETDLLKNYLLSLADRLSKSQMEPVLRQWARITARVGIATFPDLLRHHLNSRREYVRQKQLFKTSAVVSVRFNGVGRRSTHALEEVYNRAALEIRRGTVTNAGGGPPESTPNLLSGR